MRGLRHFVLLGALVWVRPLLAVPAAARGVVVVVDLPRALAGPMKAAFSSRLAQATREGGPALTLRFADVARQSGGGKRFIEEQRPPRGPAVLVCLGTRPSNLALASKRPLAPLVCFGVSGALAIKRGSPACGVTFDFAPAQVLAALRRIVPRVRRVGLVCSQGYTCPVAPKAGHQGAVTLVCRKVRRRSEIAVTAANLLRECDALWLVPDPMILERETTRYLLGRSLEAGRPVIGVSRSYVRAGALLCLEHDFDDLGRQLAEIVLQVARRGVEPAKLGFVPPRKALLLVNSKVARLLGLRLSASFFEEADVEELR